MKTRIAALFLTLLAFPAFAQTLAITPDKPSAIYAAGEPVTWSLQISGAGVASVTQVQYIVQRDAATKIVDGVLPLTNGAATLQAKLDTPGTLLATFSFTKADGTTEKDLAGVVVDPYKIQPSNTEPADFMSFWRSKIADLEKIPQNPVLTPGPTVEPSVQYAKITLDNINGTHVQGQIARPAIGNKFPAVLILQWAGVYGLPQYNVTNYAKRGWLAMNINAHDLPIDQTPDFYTAQANGPLNGYPMIGNTDRETSYFFRMVLGCCRAVDYLRSRPDWDGKTLVAMGTSQGGFQALATGGLERAVSEVIVNVPACCDTTAPRIGRLSPWPNWAYYSQNNPAAMQTSRYYDSLNFARHIAVPTLLACGLIDVTAPAPGDIAAFNQIHNPAKTLVVMPLSNHHGDGGAQAPYYTLSNAWLDALAAGKPLPQSP